MEVGEAAAESGLDVLRRLVLDEKRAVEVEAREQFAVIETAGTRSGRAPAGSGAQPVLQVAVLDATAQKVELAASVVRVNRLAIAGIPIERHLARQLPQKSLEAIRARRDCVAVDTGAF